MQCASRWQLQHISSGITHSGWLLSVAKYGVHHHAILNTKIFKICRLFSTLIQNEKSSLSFATNLEILIPSGTECISA
jgi:hypothetical protein